MTTTTFQNGQTLTSTALTPDTVEVIFQILTTQLLGVTASLQLQCNLLASSPTIATPLVPANLQPGFIVVGVGIPPATTIVNMFGQGSNLLITLSNNVTASGLVMVSFYDPVANTRVRVSWQTGGAPAFTVTDDVLFVRCIEDATPYSEVRNESIVSYDENNIIKRRDYTRLWNVFLRARGPNSFDTIRVIKSMLLEDFSHDTLAASNLYLVTAMGTPVRAPELFEGQWWEQVDISLEFLEQVTETINIPIVKSVEITGTASNGEPFDTTVTID